MTTDGETGSNRGPEGLSTHSESPPEDVAALYDAWATAYDDDLRAWEYRVPETIAALLAADGLPDGEILDAGCGTGLSGEALRAVGAARVLGVDLSPASLEVAARRGVYEATMVVDLTGPLPFDDDRFEAAVSAGVFTYVGDPEPVLDELVRVVRPGGTIIFSQRTDVWVTRECDAVLDRLRARTGAVIDVSDPQPYLPGHPEFGSDIQVVYATISLPS